MFLCLGMFNAVRLVCARASDYLIPGTPSLATQTPAPGPRSAPLPRPHTPLQYTLS